MHTLILTAAGRSTRFPNHRPKWSLTHPSGNMMCAEAIRGLRGYDKLLVAMRQDHVDQYCLSNIEREFSQAGFPRAEIVMIPETNSQVETIMAALAVGEVKGAFTIKDCDNSFKLTLDRIDNAVAVVGLGSCGLIVPGNKSYVRLKQMYWVEEIAEKKVISDLFCCGAYTFNDADLFRYYVNGYDIDDPASYVSDVIAAAIRDGEEFRIQHATDYQDWGTEDDWDRFRQDYCTIFVDIDGVLCESSHRSFWPRWGESRIIESNVDALNDLHRTGKVTIILTTSRPEAARDVTEEQLATLKYDRLIMDLPNTRRVLVNDVVVQRGENTAKAINIARNAPELKAMLRAK